MPDIYLTPLDARETLSGVEIAEDLANCLVEGLRNNADLRPTDAFAGYAATIKVELQLQDVDTTETEQVIKVGALDSEILTQRIDVIVPQADALEVRERSELPEPSFEKQASTLPATPKRWYTPRNAASKNHSVSER